MTCNITNIRNVHSSLSDRNNQNSKTSSYNDCTYQFKNIEEWYTSIIKPMSFYESQAKAGEKQKNYFYNIDLRGQVFLEETFPKNSATSIKDPAFLQTLLRRIRRVNEKEKNYLSSINLFDNHELNCGEYKHYDCKHDYPFVSPCGKELNFIRPVDTPIVFHSLIQHNTNDNYSKEENKYNSDDLIFGNSFHQPFDPNELRLSKQTNRIYHPLIRMQPSQIKEMSHVLSETDLNRFHLPSSMYQSENKEYGLMQASLVVSLSDYFSIDNSNENMCSDDENIESEFSGMTFHYQGYAYGIKWLPCHAEPGKWAYKGIENTSE